MTFLDIVTAQREGCAKFIEQASLREGRPVHAERCRAAPLVTLPEGHMLVLREDYERLIASLPRTLRSVPP